LTGTEPALPGVGAATLSARWLETKRRVGGDEKRRRAENVAIAAQVAQILARIVRRSVVKASTIFFLKKNNLGLRTPPFLFFFFFFFFFAFNHFFFFLQRGFQTLTRLFRSPKMAEVSRRHFPRSNTPRSIHTPLSLGLRADAELHLVVLFNRRNTHAVVFHILAYQHIPA
jgi:hypothetical protein